MMSTLQTLLEQQSALTTQIEKLRHSERSDAVAKVKSLMGEYGLTVADIGGNSSTPRVKGTRSTAGSKVAAKFRDAASGNTWSGRGLTPRWLKAAVESGKKLEDFTV